LGAGRLRNSVVVAEVALSFVLLVGCGLMIRSFIALQRVDLGYDPHEMLTFHLLGGGGLTPQDRAAFQREIKARLQAIPGVRGITASTPLPLAGGAFVPIRWGTAVALADPTRY